MATKKQPRKITKPVENVTPRKTEALPKMSPALYWEWRCTIEELENAKLRERQRQLERDLMSREIENKKLRLALFSETFTTARTSRENAEREYAAMKARIEQELEIEFENCTVDEYTYEVRNINDTRLEDE